MKIVTCYRAGRDYNEKHVERLAKNVHDVFGTELEVIEDERWPGWWCKMAMFENPARFLYADLDTIFVKPLSGFPEDKPIFIRDFYNGSGVASGLMYVTPEMCKRVWFDWMFYDPDELMAIHKGDQDFLATCYGPEEFVFWQDVAPGQVCSFKIHCQDKPPESAAVICYHGKPRIHETNWATGGAARWRKIDETKGYAPP